MKKAIGIDVGGTKVAIAVIYEDGTMSNRLDFKTPNDDAEALFSEILRGITQLLQDTQTQIADYCGIGLGVPGKVDEKNGIAVFQNNIQWRNFPIVDRLKEIFPNTIVKIDNDVKVAAYAEYRILNLAVDEMLTYYTISTGIACTNIINNQIMRGAGFSGEVGLLQVSTANGLHRLEAVASGPTIENKGKSLYCDKTLTTADVFQKWKVGDFKATKIIEESIEALAKSIYAIICINDPKVITFGGSVSIHNPEFIEAIKVRLSDLLHPEQHHILGNIHISTLGGHNGIIGAGFLVIPIEKQIDSK